MTRMVAVQAAIHDSKDVMQNHASWNMFVSCTIVNAMHVHMYTAGPAMGRRREAAAQAGVPAEGATRHKANRSFTGPASRKRHRTAGSRASLWNGLYV